MRTARFPATCWSGSRTPPSFWAPSAGFSQGLRLVVVTDEATRREIAVAAAEEELAAQGRPRWKAAAPVHVVVLTRENDHHTRYQSPDKLKITGGKEIEWPAPYWYVDAGAAAMTLMLAAIDEGLDTAVFGSPIKPRCSAHSACRTT